MQLKTNGIVLRSRKFEDSRVLSILTESQGVLSAFAGGASRPRSKLSATAELLSYSSMILFRHRDRCSMDKADSIRVFFGIREDLDKLALASYLAELTDELAPKGEEAGAYLRLLLNTLHLLETDARPTDLLKAVYELRLLTMAGYMPVLVGCRECSRFEADPMFFFPQHGDLLCETCAAAENSGGGVPLTPGVLAAMRHITYSEPDKLFSFAMTGPGLLLLRGVTEDYLKYQLEKTFPTLEFYHSLRGIGGEARP